MRLRLQWKPRLRLRNGSLLPLCLLVAGCGPTIALNVGLTENPIDIILGLQHRASPPPAAGLNVNLPAEAFPFPPVPAAGSSLSTVPVPCPTADPLSAPALEADATGTKLPAQATYPFHYKVTLTSNVGASNEKVTSYPSTGTRQIANVLRAETTKGDGAYNFDVIEKYAGETNTTSYRVLPQGAAAPPVGSNAVAAGIYITKETSVSQTGATTFTFNPQPMLLVLPFPAQIAQSFQAHSSDAVDQVSETLQPATSYPAYPGYPPFPGYPSPPNYQNSPLPNPSYPQYPTPQPPSPSVSGYPPTPPPNVPGTQVLDHQRVDACGTYLDSWRVELVGTLTNQQNNSAESQSFDDLVDFATQFGSFPVAEHRVHAITKQDGSKYKLDFSVNIGAAPNFAHN